MHTSTFIPAALIGLALALTACQPRQDSTKLPGSQQPAAAPAQQAAPDEHSDAPAAPEQQAKASPTDSMVSLNVTNQPYSVIQPWNKEKPSYSEGYALYLGNGDFLTAANIVDNAGYLEMSYADGARTVPATVIAIDREANLALLRVKSDTDKDFVDQLTPIALAPDSPKLEDNVAIWQYNSDGLPIITKGQLLATQSDTPYEGNLPFVLYNIKTSVTPLLGGAGNPVMTEDGKLLGLSASCNPAQQKLLAVTHTMLRRFLATARKPGYQGFPIDGMSVTELNDPVFRKYLGLPSTGGGLYICDLPPYSSFYKAGVRPGDVLESINGRKLDAKGIIRDPKLGPISCNMLLRDDAQVGDTITLGLKRRDKGSDTAKDITIKATLDRSPLDGDIIFNGHLERPGYTIYGGLVFVPVTGELISNISQLLKNHMPMAILDMLDRKANLQKDGARELVMLLFVLPTQATKGYDGVAPALVEKVDGIQVRDLNHLNELLDKPGTNGLHRIDTNTSPYTIYVDTATAQQADAYIKAGMLPVLRQQTIK